MRKFKTKLASILMALTCVFACLGVGVFVANNNGLEARAAANTYTITKLGALPNGATATAFYAYAVEGEKPAVGSWSYEFTFVAESGEGVKFNGEAYEGWKVKQPGSDLYIELGREAAVGDVFTIGGTFFNADADAEIIIPTTSFEWNGTAWVDYVEYAKHNIGALDLHVNSQPWGGAGAQHNAIYLQRADGEALPFENWDIGFAAASAENFKINGENASFAAFKSTNAGLYIGFTRDLEVGEYITVSGTFVCDANLTKYVVEKSSFVWTSEGWDKYVVVNYETYTVTEIGSTAASTNSVAYFYSKAGDELPKAKGDWDNKYTLVEGEITLNGNPITLAEVKMPGDLYVVLGFDAQAGDVLAFNGALANSTKAIKIVFENCELKWDGSAWVANEVAPEPPALEYETYTVTKIGGYKGTLSQLYVYSLGGDNLPKEKVSDDWANVYTVVEGAITLNGEARDITDIKFPGDLFIGLGFEPEAGDVIALNCTLVNDTTLFKFVFVNCELKWNGEAWVENVVTPEPPVVEYTTYEIGALNLHNNSVIGGAKGDSSVIYLKRVDGETFPVLNWEKPFVAENADNFKVNGVAHSLVKVVSTNDGFYWSFGEALNAGDYITISGTFACESELVKYVIEESSFVWTGTAWELYVDYTTHETTGLIFAQTGEGNKHVYFVDAEGHDFPVATTENNLNWTTPFSWKDGVGVTLNGNAVSATVKFPGQMFIDLGVAPNVDDVLVVGGTFYSPALAFAYVIEETTFTWDGTTWVAEGTETPEPPVVEYEVFTVTAIGPAGGCTNAVLYIYSTAGDPLPKERGDWDNKYTLVEGEVTLNGNPVTLSEVKLPGDLYVVLGFEAQAGDVLAFNGAFANETTGFKFVFVNCELTWNGEAWVENVVTPEPPVVEYEVFTVTAIGPAGGCTNAVLYIYSTAGDPLPKERGDWDNKYTLVEGEVTLNGTPISLAEVKLPGDLYVVLGFDAQAGDVLAFNGAFANETTGFKFVFVNCQLKWNGEAWVTVSDPVDPPKPPVGNVEVIEIGEVIAVSGNNSGVYLNFKHGTVLPIDSWDFAFNQITGNGVTVDGVMVDLNNNIKSVGNALYVGLGDAVVEGSLLNIGGTFYNADTGYQYVIEDSEFVWDGKSWNTTAVVEIKTYELGELILHPNSTIGPALDRDDVLYLMRTEEQELPFMSWDFVFVAESDDCFKINGKNASLFEVKSTDGGLYLAFSILDKGDYVTIGGTFYCESQHIRYIIEESSFEWTGTGWIPYVSYETVELGAVVSVIGNKSAINLVFADGVELPVHSWDFAFNQVSGNGITVDGVMVRLNNNIKSVENTIYVDLSGSAIEGSILKISGSFRNVETALEYVIEESVFVWDGANWSNEDVVGYTVVQIGDVEVVSGSESSITAVPADAKLKLPVDDWDSNFVCASGNGITLDGVKVDAEIKSFNGEIFIGLGDSVAVGTVLQIGGIFVCEDALVKYVIEDCEFEWTGDAWISVRTIKTYELGELSLHNNSILGDPSKDNSVLYLKRTDGRELPIHNWDHAFYNESDDCVMVNGEPAFLLEMKSTIDGLFLKFDPVSAGDVISISGRFVCETLGVVYEIEESRFEWTGKSWTPYVDYTYYELGEMCIHASDSSEGAIFILRLDEGGYPVASWDYVFLFRYGSGVGVTINGETLETNDIKSPGGSVYIGFVVNGETIKVKVGDVVTVGGTFCNVDTATAYIIEESTFIYTADGWVSEIDLIKKDAIKAINDKFKTLNQENYYDAEWNYMISVVTDSETAIEKAISKAEVSAVLEEALKELEETVTKEESDLIFDDFAAESKAELASYKNEADYRANEWATITAIVEKAIQKIDASASVTEIKIAVREAKEAIDLVKTDAQLKEDEAYVASAKAELASYKNEADYRASEWAQIQAIIAEANANIDYNMGDTVIIDEIVAEAKAEIDLVKVREVAEADEMFVAQAKAELATYKNSSDYYKEEWAEIQAIINKAGLAIDEAIGNEEEIANIVAEAKAEIDEVMIKEEADVAKFQKAQDDAKKAVRDYYASLDHSLYTDEAEAKLSKLASDAVTKIEKAKTVEEMNAAVKEFKAAADAVEKIQKEEESEQESSKGGCGSSIGGGLTCLLPALAFAVARIARKKED